MEALSGGGSTAHLLGSRLSLPLRHMCRHRCCSCIPAGLQQGQRCFHASMSAAHSSDLAGGGGGGSGAAAQAGKVAFRCRVDKRCRESSFRTAQVRSQPPSGIANSCCGRRLKHASQVTSSPDSTFIAIAPQAEKMRAEGRTPFTSAAARRCHSTQHAGAGPALHPVVLLLAVALPFTFTNDTVSAGPTMHCWICRKGSEGTLSLGAGTARRCAASATPSRRGNRTLNGRRRRQAAAAGAAGMLPGRAAAHQACARTALRSRHHTASSATCRGAEHRTNVARVVAAERYSAPSGAARGRRVGRQGPDAGRADAAGAATDPAPTCGMLKTTRPERPVTSHTKAQLSWATSDTMEMTAWRQRRGKGKGMRLSAAAAKAQLSWATKDTVETGPGDKEGGKERGRVCQRQQQRPNCRAHQGHGADGGLETKKGERKGDASVSGGSKGPAVVGHHGHGGDDGLQARGSGAEGGGGFRASKAAGSRSGMWAAAKLWLWGGPRTARAGGSAEQEASVWAAAGFGQQSRGLGDAGMILGGMEWQAGPTSIPGGSAAAGRPRPIRHPPARSAWASRT